MDKVKRQMKERIKEGVASGVAAVGKGTEVLRSLLGSGDQPTKVQEVKSDAYTSRHILSREDSLVLYQPGPSTGKRDKAYFEIVLHRPFTESLDQAYSLFRAETQDDAEVKFICFKDKIPIIVDVAKEMGQIANLQKLCDCLTEHPAWSTAHLAAYFALNEAFQHTAVNSQLNCSDPLTGESPLQVACRAGHLKTVQRMVGAKCSLEHLDYTGNSVYHFAAETNKEIILALVQGTTPRCLNARNHAGYTPLHVACRCDKPGCVKALLLAGADVNIEAVEAREGATATSLPTPPTSPSGSIASGVLSNLPGYVGNFVQDNPNKLHAQDMKYGGTPLHWACSKEVIETLVDMHCHINALNFNKRTALHIMVLRGRLDCVVALLARQADPDLGDMDGNRPIHLAIQQGNVSIVQSLIVFGAQLDLHNNQGHTARHILSREQEPKLLYYLHAVGASRCTEEMVDCTDGCRISGEYNGDAPPAPLPPTNRDILNQMLAQAAVTMRSAAAGTSAAHGGDTVTDSSNGGQPSTVGGRILSLDGGGIRGLVLIQMLLEMETYLEGKPINNCFDWIAGTSTGGILALGIATGKTMKECLCLYFRMKEVSFAGFRPYPSEALETVLQETFGIDTVMTDIKKPKVLVTGCLADRKPVELHLFRNYQAPLDVLGITDPLTRTPGGTMEPPAPPAQQKIWQVGRASGAAPTYFKQFQQFLDGGLIANNPTMDALSEVHEYNLALRAVGRETEISAPTVVVSLGTGLIPVTQMSEYAVESIWQGLKLFSHLGSLGTLLVDQATSSDGRVVDRARAWCSMIGVPYYRYSPQMSEDVPMDEKNDERLVRLLWETKAYMYSNQALLREMAKLLNNE